MEAVQLTWLSFSRGWRDVAIHFTSNKNRFDKLDQGQLLCDKAKTDYEEGEWILTKLFWPLVLYMMR